MAWQQIASEIDSWKQLGCVIEWKVGTLRTYRFRFFRCDGSQVEMEDGYFDALEGEVEAIRELMTTVGDIVTNHAWHQLTEQP